MSTLTPDQVNALAAELARSGVITDTQRDRAGQFASDPSFAYNFKAAAALTGKERHARMWELLPYRDGATGEGAPSASHPAPGLLASGWVLVLAGVALGAFSYTMDTTVSVYPNVVHNIGLIADRVITAVAAGAASVAGVACFVGASLARRIAN